MNDLRIVLLGKTGDGKSSCANTILNEDVFPIGHLSISETHKCESRTKLINEKEISVVDTPGLFVTSLPEKELKSEILRCIVECAPGPHAFVIVLRVGRYTDQEKEIVNKLTAAFGEEALKYAVVLFTHGDQLSEDQRIEDFVKQSTELQGLVDKCGGRVHVIDNKYWNQQQDEYRNNRVQVEKLLKTIEEMVRKNGGLCYSNEILQEVNRAIEVEFGVTVGALLGALLGFGAALDVSYTVAQVVPPQAAACVFGSAIIAGSVAGAVVGGCVGYKAVEGAETLTEAMKRSAKVVWEYEKIEQLIKRFQKI
uniref:AIG1-type G domain-containing protein n=1 Tax=Pygocentrus nattereri TaxID=42514 RepID=A0AAR2JA84_PYGNA